ncbi:MAG: EamA family transporter [Bacteroidaceae bacterium]|nr:EamA family transporter [Bacteroidaceae bacterium]
MWLLLAFASAALLGFYDVCKKLALKGNAVIPVLTLNTLFCSLIFLPFIVLSATGHVSEQSLFFVPVCGWEVHKYILLKAVIVLASWLCGYLAIQNLPLTLVGPINATRPVMVLLGAIVVFGERLNLYQWLGVLLAIFSFYLLSRSGKKEGIDFRHNRWIALAVLAAVFGAISGLYDKYILASPEAGGVGLPRMTVQSFFMIYQFVMMCIVLFVVMKKQHFSLSTFHFSFSIFLISLFLSLADFVYFYALSLPGALISVVSMIRRGSVLVSFTIGAFVFCEKNLRSKAIDLALVLLSMLFLYLGSI